MSYVEKSISFVCINRQSMLRVKIFVYFRTPVSFNFLLHPHRVRKSQRAVRNIRIRVHLVGLPHRISLEEAAELRGVRPGAAVVQSGLGIVLATGEEAGIAVLDAGPFDREPFPRSGFGVGFPEGGVGVFKGGGAASFD